jgi:outer membrane protein assembly factor BamB
MTRLTKTYLLLVALILCTSGLSCSNRATPTNKTAGGSGTATKQPTGPAGSAGGTSTGSAVEGITEPAMPGEGGTAASPSANAPAVQPVENPADPGHASGRPVPGAGGQAHSETGKPGVSPPGAAGQTSRAQPQQATPAESVVQSPNAGASTAQRIITGDWPMWGGTIHRNMVNATTGITIDFVPSEDPAKAKNILWVAKLGSQTYGNPVVANGKVLVGTNNGAEYRPKHKGDRGCVLCFDEKTGKFLWQLTREKLPQGRVNDWPLQGICSTCCVDEGRVYVVTNRCELMCLDLDGFYDNENDGPFTQETDNELEDADIIWSLDMMETLGVFPHNLATSSPVVYGDLVYILTSNGVDEAHLEIPSPRAPSFIAVNKFTGEVVWEDNSPFDKILHGQWSSPAVAEVNGRAMVFFAGGNGWLYALDAKTGEHIWKFDLNPKDAKYELGGRGTRNYIVATPVFVDNSIVLASGQDPEHGEGVGHLYRIDCTKTGDISAELDEDEDGKGEPNPNSGMIWHYGGFDQDGSVTGEKGSYIFRRTIATVAVHDGLVYAADLSGRLHCVDFKTGQRYWEADLLAAIWGSPMVVDGKVLIGDEDGDLTVFAEGKQLRKLAEITFPASVYSTPTIANGVMYISDRSRLWAIKILP